MERGNGLKRTALTVVDASGKLVRPSLPKRGPGILDEGVRTHRGAGSLAMQPMPSAVHFTAEESERFLRIVAGALRVKRHYELFLFTQGELQHFIPHQILIAAWGDFAGSNLTLDVVSAIPGVRTGLLNGCGINVANLLKQLYLPWVAGGRQPLLLSKPKDHQCLKCSDSGCALHSALQGMRSILVHGMDNHRDGIESLYLALNSGSIANGYSLERFHLLADALVSQIDVAFRNVVGLQSARISAAGDQQARRGDLSAREVQIMVCVAEGRTNHGIAAILGITPNTVKNHMKRIFAKLGATNRTEAVAKYGQTVQHPPTR